MIVYEITSKNDKILINKAEVEEKPKTYTIVKRIDKEFEYCSRILKTDIDKIRIGYNGIRIFTFDVDFALGIYREKLLNLIKEKEICFYKTIDSFKNRIDNIDKLI